MRGTRARHEHKLGYPAGTLEKLYGWDLVQMAEDAQRAYAHKCPGCRKAFSGMVHGLGDISLDICDRARAPFYLNNVGWLCVTCNRAKSQMTPDDWAEFCIGRDIWIRQQVIGSPQKKLPF